VLVEGEQGEVAHYIQDGRRAQLPAEGYDAWESHFVTCPADLSERQRPASERLGEAALLARRLASTLDELSRQGEG
jgi:hypothetical protein